jgi:purine-binding chemotaxis protein CheW
MVSRTAVADDAATHAPAAAQWVVFLCNGDRFGILLDRVREIVAPRQFTRVPGAGRNVCGLVGIRGRVVTVVDLGSLLGGRPAAATPDHRLLLLDIEGRRIGAAVEAVVTIAAAGVEALAPASAPGSVPPEALLGSGRVEDGEFMALDPAPLLRHLLSQTTHG